MDYTPLERRRKLAELAAADADCAAVFAELEQATQILEEYTNTLPKETASLLWAYPTTLHIYHHRLLDLVCQVMRFPSAETGDS